MSFCYIPVRWWHACRVSWWWPTSTPFICSRFLRNINLFNELLLGDSNHLNPSIITERIVLKIQTFRNQPMIKCHPRRTNLCWFWWRHGLIKVSINVGLSATFYGASILIHFDVQILCANKQNFFLLNRVECSFIEL